MILSFYPSFLFEGERATAISDARDGGMIRIAFEVEKQA
jgi:hypothetical protein